MQSFFKFFSHRQKAQKKSHVFKKPVLRVYEHTKQDRCVGCGLCQAICPVNAIEISSSFQDDKTVKVEEFSLNGEACLQCDLCVDACPTKALEFEPSAESVKPRVYSKDEMTIYD